MAFLARRAHVLVVGIHRDVGERLPAAHLAAHGPRDGLRPEHDPVVGVVELLAERVSETRALLDVELAHGRLDGARSFLFYRQGGAESHWMRS